VTEPLDHNPRVDPVWIVGFTGHRPSDAPGRSAAELAACRPALRRTLESLSADAKAAGGRVELCCSAAEGSDLLAIDVARELGLPVHVVLPVTVESFADDFRESPAGVWDAVQEAVERARDPRSDWSLRVAAGDHARPGCYHDVNLQILESSDILVAIFNGIASKSTGGSAEMIEAAAEDRLNVPVIVLDPTKEGAAARSDALPVATEADRRLDELNAYMSEEIALRSDEAFQRGGPEAIWAVHKALDNVANNSGRAFRGSIKVTILLHFSATCLAAINAAFAKALAGSWIPKVLTAVELGLVLVATLLIWRAHRARTNPKWRRSRFGAELADGLVLSAPLIDPLQPVVNRHDGSWKRFAVSVGLAAARQRLAGVADLEPAARLERMRHDYLENRIRHQRDRYFRSHESASSRILRRWTFVSTAASIVAIAAITAALVFKVMVPTAGKDLASATLVLFLPIFLPLLAALGSSMIVANDAARRKARYAQVKVRLDWFDRLVPAIGTEATLRRAVGDAEDLLLDELIEWNAKAAHIGH